MIKSVLNRVFISRVINISAGLLSAILGEYALATTPTTTQTALFAEQVACERTADMPPKLRMEDYQRPTPACVPNAITLDTAQVQQLIAERKPLLIDVLGATERHDPDFGHEWLPREPRQSLPNAVWLPNVGRGILDAHLERYLTEQLQALTQGNKDQPIVLFCVADCWMSWNAAQRVHEMGYTQVYWYKLGTDGWKEAKLPLIEVEPTPLVHKVEHTRFAYNWGLAAKSIVCEADKTRIN